MDCQTVYLNIAGMKPLPIQTSRNAWTRSVGLLERWLGQRARLDGLLEMHGRMGPISGAGCRRKGRNRAVAARGSGGGLAEMDEGQERARCQHLLFGAVRHWGGSMPPWDPDPRPPRVRLRAVLLVAGFELLEAGSAPAGRAQAAKIVHHAVAQAKTLLSPAEARLVNAVLRKLAGAPGLRDGPPTPAAGVAELARFFSHPEWLVRRWLAQFGAEATGSLLRWNQIAAAGLCPLARPGPEPGPAARPGSSHGSWPGFYVVPAGQWPEIERLLAEGALYLQDPATLTAAALLDPEAGETVLDLCAAPGGKSLLLADLLEKRARQAGSTRRKRAGWWRSTCPTPRGSSGSRPIWPRRGGWTSCSSRPICSSSTPSCSRSTICQTGSRRSCSMFRARIPGSCATGWM